MGKYFYIKENQYGELYHDAIFFLRERHKIALPLPEKFNENLVELAVCIHHPKGVIFQLDSGLPTITQIKVAKKLIKKNRCLVWFYWPEEQALEFIAKDDLKHYQHIRLFVTFLKINQFLFSFLFKFTLSIYRKYRHPNTQTPQVATSFTTPVFGLDTKHNHPDQYKNETQKQWDQNPCGSHYASSSELHSLNWYLEVEKYRYEIYAPWMKEMMDFARYHQRQVLEIGGGLATDLAQFAIKGADVTDLDLSLGHLTLAQENFKLRNLSGTFCQGDAECLPFPDNYFDLVYSNGVIHHTPHTQKVIKEIWRVLKPGGNIIIMVYARNSFYYWRLIFFDWFLNGWYQKYSIGEMMSTVVEKTTTDTKPLVKVYAKKALSKLFKDFSDINIFQRQLTKKEFLFLGKFVPLNWLGKLVGWNLIIKARKAV